MDSIIIRAFAVLPLLMLMVREDTIECLKPSGPNLMLETCLIFVIVSGIIGCRESSFLLRLDQRIQRIVSYYPLHCTSMFAENTSISQPFGNCSSATLIQQWFQCNHSLHNTHESQLPNATAVCDAVSLHTSQHDVKIVVSHVAPTNLLINKCCFGRELANTTSLFQALLQSHAHHTLSSLQQFADLGSSCKYSSLFTAKFTKIRNIHPYSFW